MARLVSFKRKLEISLIYNVDQYADDSLSLKNNIVADNLQVLEWVIIV
jgi:hypothetical protein